MTMDMEEEYDYTASLPFIERFVNPFPDKDYIEEMAEEYGSLWQLKSCVRWWSFGVNRIDNYVYLLHNEKSTVPPLQLNRFEKVSNIELFYDTFIVLTVTSVDAKGVELTHVHSIVVKIEENSAKFDICGLVEHISGEAKRDLEDPIKSKFMDWSFSSENNLYRKINNLYRFLCKYVEKSKTLFSASAVEASSPMSTASLALKQSRVRCGNEDDLTQPLKKKRKSVSNSGNSRPSTSGGVSRNSAFRGKSLSVEISEIQRITKEQTDFWNTHSGCYIFGQQTYSVDINQCLIARDEYIIRTLEDKMLDIIMKALVQLGDINQRQKICLTPVDEEGNLLKTCPSNWDEIKNGKFMIINGQHSVTASQRLQEQECGVKRREELQHWDAYIVWTLDEIKLHNISKFYNSVNHIVYEQPTWGNQIVSCRNIWLAHSRPTTVATESRVRGNQATYNPVLYKVTFLLFSRTNYL